RKGWPRIDGGPDSQDSDCSRRRSETYHARRSVRRPEAPVLARSLTGPPLMKVAAIVPARGGSKGVPKKNIRPLAGYPLIAYAVVAGKLAGNIDRVFVSHDRQAIVD